MEVPKWLIIAFLTLVLFGSISLLGVCAWVIREYEALQDLVGSSDIKLEDASFCGIAAGTIAIVTSLWAICGLSRPDKCVLGVTLGGLFVTACLEFAIVVMAFSFMVQFDNQYGSVAVDAISRHYKCTTAEAETVTKAWDGLQSSKQCCGFYNGSDYEGSFFDQTTFHLHPWPSSCCVAQDANEELQTCLQTGNATLSNAAKGCKEHLSPMLTNYALAVGLTALLLMFGEYPLIALLIYEMRILLGGTEEDGQPAKPISISLNDSPTTDEHVYHNA